MSEQEDIPAGTLLTVTSGAYSDYMVMGVFRALKTIPITKCHEDYLSLYPEQRKQNSFLKEKFISYLIKGGFIDMVDSQELYLGCYFDEEMYTYEFNKIEES